MGSIFSRFRKQPTTLEQLKKIEDGLQKIEEYKRITERKQKRTVASVVLYGAALYILACVIVFVWYLPESWLVRLGLLIPLVLVPLIIYWMKRLISKYFQSKMVRANEDFEVLQKKKKDIIDSVMETETFNKAREILAKYAPEKLGKKEANVPKITPVPSEPVRENPATVEPEILKPEIGKPVFSDMSSTTDLRRRMPQPPQKYPVLLRSNIGAHMEQKMLLSARLNDPSMGPRRPPPQPVLPKIRSLSDKVIDYIVGDGPNHRYALICAFCKGHNGMAIKEEFPYLSYTCCYCLSYNAARTRRPSAPRLQIDRPLGLPEDENQLVEEESEGDQRGQHQSGDNEGTVLEGKIELESEKHGLHKKSMGEEEKNSDHMKPKNLDQPAGVVDGSSRSEMYSEVGNEQEIQQEHVVVADNEDISVKKEDLNEETENLLQSITPPSERDNPIEETTVS